jgi:hypothetical protein
LLLTLSASVSAHAQEARQQAQTQTAAVNVTGYYTYRQSNVSNSLAVLRLPDGKIKFQLIALLLVGQGARNGEVRGIASLENSTAVYDENGCQVTMKFSRTSAAVSVSNEDACGFGAYVTANGVYAKRNSRKPKFDF